MRIRIRVKTHARKNEVKQLNESQFLISVTAPPLEGKANEKVIELLAEYFDRPKRSVTILRGKASRDKIVDVE